MSGDRQRCVCGHPRETHDHYRRGSDCSLCGIDLCPRFRRPSVLAMFLGRRRPQRHQAPLSVVPDSEPGGGAAGPTWQADRTRDDAAS